MDSEIVVLACGNIAALAQQSLNVGLYPCGIDSVLRRYHDAIDIGVACQPTLEGPQRYQHDIVLIGAEG
jgi:hypothetical protein